MTLGSNMKIVKWIKAKIAKKRKQKKTDRQLMLEIIENTNKKVLNIFYKKEWMIIHQGNDYY